MNKNIKKTKKSLSVAFSAIVFLSVFAMGIIFFSTKYVREIWMEKAEFFRFVWMIESRKMWFEDIQFWPRFEFQKMNWNHQNTQIKIIQPQWYWPHIGNFINYLMIDNNSQVIFANVKDNVPEKILANALEWDYYLKPKQDHSYLIQKIKLEDWKYFIAFKRLDYSYWDLLWDILWFLIILILFTIVVYFVWKRFVDRVFVPVEENMKDMNDFIHNAGHELKTPISVIDSNLQMMKEMKSYDEWMIKEQKDEIIKLNSLIDSLIDLSDIDVFKNIEQLDLKTNIEEVLNDLKTRDKKKKIEINLKVKDWVIIEANKNYLYIFLSNIIWNAVKYNKKEGSVDISYKSGELIIKDTWIWIKKEELDKIFDRFYKWDESRNSEWFWIWLSLVKKIASTYKWDLKVESEEGKWTSFKIKF